MATSSFLPLPEISSLITDSLFGPFDNSAQMWLLIAPLVALQLGLMVVALLDWARRPRTRHLDRWFGCSSSSSLAFWDLWLTFSWAARRSKQRLE